MLDGDDAAIDEEDEFAGLSRFEKEQQRMNKTIGQLEDFNAKAKPWQLAGGLFIISQCLFDRSILCGDRSAPDTVCIVFFFSFLLPWDSVVSNDLTCYRLASTEIDARGRPLNSLLQEDIAFDVTTRPGTCSLTI